MGRAAFEGLPCGSLPAMSLLAAAVATLILGHEEQKKLQLGVVLTA